MSMERKIPKRVNEATADKVGGAGGYVPPLQPGMREFKKSDLGPFTNSVSDYNSPLVAYDSYDHTLDLKKNQIKKLEKTAKKITDYIKHHPYSTFSDEDGGIINQTPSGKNKKAPYNLEIVPITRKGSKSKINEITTSTTAGEYSGPQELGMRKWKPSELAGYTETSTNGVNMDMIKRSIKDNIKKVIGGWEPQKGKFEVPTFDVNAKKEKRVKSHGELLDDPINWYKKFNKKRTSKTNIAKKVAVRKIAKESIKEDLAVWFGKKKKPKGSSQPKGPWVDICRKVDGKHPPCGRQDTSKGSYPKCRAAGVAGKMTDSQKRSACQQKRSAEKKDTQTGKGQKPIMTSYKPKNKTNEQMSRIINLTESDIKRIVMRVLKEDIQLSTDTTQLNKKPSLSEGLNLTCVQLNIKDPKNSLSTNIGPFPWSQVKYDKESRPVKLIIRRSEDLPSDGVFDDIILEFEEIIDPKLKGVLTDKKYVMKTYQTPEIQGKQYCRVNGAMDPEWDKNLFSFGNNSSVIDPYPKID